MVNMEQAISKMNQLKNAGVTYSMYGSRTGADGTADCSGAVYTALRAGGGTNFGYVPSTETLHAYLLLNGFKCIAENRDWSMQRGDVVIWGRKGESAGAGGHTGICTSNQLWYECTAWKNGVIQSNHDQRWSMNNGPYFYAYRQVGNTTQPNGVPSGFTPEKATFTNGDTPFPIRLGSASLSAPKDGNIGVGAKFAYDSVAKIGKYTWVHQMHNGNHRYLPVREWGLTGWPNGKPYGTFG